jgi:hypothetical protein
MDPCYVVEHMIRDRLAEARATAKVAALLRQRDPRRSRANGLGRSPGKRAWKLALELSRVLRSWSDVTKRFNHATADVRRKPS